jgi:hypothetical protein
MSVYTFDMYGNIHFGNLIIFYLQFVLWNIARYFEFTLSWGGGAFLSLFVHLI